MTNPPRAAAATKRCIRTAHTAHPAKLAARSRGVSPHDRANVFHEAIHKPIHPSVP
jgi:hypothetical protein